jgi:hypothetical protein
MFRMIRWRTLVFGALLAPVVMAAAQTQRQGEALSVEGYAGEAAVIQFHGRAFVDVQDLAKITQGFLSFEKDRVILTLRHPDPAESAGGDAGKATFSRGFTSAAIEAMASIREWGGMLQVIVQNGYPVGKAAAGNTIRAYQGRAADHVALAAAAASTDSDYRGLELLRNQFNNLQIWAESFIEARNSLRAANLSTSENALKNDEGAQKIMNCGQFLEEMIATRTFQDDPACH